MHNVRITKCYLHDLCKFSAPVFKTFWETLRDDLQSEPDDSAGLLGPGRARQNQESFHSWVADYANNGIGRQFWGPRTQEKWKLSEDKREIVDFLKLCLRRQGRTERVRRMRRGVVTVDNSTFGGIVGEEREEKGELSDDGDPVDEVLRDEDYDDAYGGYEDEAQEDEGPVGGMRNQLLHIAIPSPTHKTRLHKSPSAVSINNTQVPANSRLLRSSIKKQTFARESLTFSKCPRLPMPKDWAGPSAADRDNHHHPPAPSEADRVFKTRLGNDKTITLLFAPPTISFKGFFEYFCEAWSKSSRMGSGDVEVRVSIPGLGEYRVGSQSSREKGWCHIMKLVESKPESEILVTVEL